MTGELAAIARLRAGLPGPPAGETWIGDDAAVLALPAGGWLLFAADAVVAGVHADLSLTGLDDLGWKAVVANVSDLAAMGGEPGHAVVTVAGPPGTDLDVLYAGISAAAACYRCPVVGGDLVSAPTLVVTVAVLGRVDGRPVLRSGARPGDGIWVTGPLGAAAAGLRRLRAGRDGTGPDAELDAELRRAHARPRPDVAGGRAAREAGATAMIDVSDGLVADLGHLADESAVGVRLDGVPVAPGATEAEALAGGEDYVLVFCAPEGAPVAEAFAGRSTPVRIGTCVADRAERSLRGEPLPPGGWEHPW